MAGEEPRAYRYHIQSYSREPIPLVGHCYVNLTYKGQEASEIPLIVVEGSGPSHLGRDWLGHIQFDWRQIHHIYTSSLQQVLDRQKPVFEGGLGTMEGFKDKIYIDQSARPRFIPARSVPYALGDKINKELDRL